MALHESQDGHKARVKRKLDEASWRRDVQSGIEHGGREAARGSSTSSAAPETFQVPPIQLRPNDCFGQYSVRGEVYLEGQWHHDAIISGVHLQIAMPEDEEGEPGDWVDCKLESTREVFDQVNEFRSFLHTVVVRTEEGEEQTYEVGPDALRIKVPSRPLELSAWSSVEFPSNEKPVQNEEEDSREQPTRSVEIYKGVALDLDERPDISEIGLPGASGGTVEIKRRKTANKNRKSSSADD